MLGFNNSSFITKELKRKIIKRTKLKCNFNKNKNYENWYNFRFQRDY